MSWSNGICHGVSDGIAMKSSTTWGNVRHADRVGGVRLCHGNGF